MTDHKLPSRRFDSIFRACKNHGVYKGSGFAWWVIKEAPLLYDSWVDGRVLCGDAACCGTGWDGEFMRAYEDGEIRDAGPYPEGEPCFVVQMPDGRIIKPTGYEGIPSGNGIYCHPDETWYKLDPAKFDPLVSDPVHFLGTLYQLHSKIVDRLPIIGSGIPREICPVIIQMYTSGILRRGGALEVCETCGSVL